MVQCVPGASALIKLQRKTCELGNWGLMAKEVFSPSGLDSYLPQTCTRHTGSFFSSLQHQLWSWFWAFWNYKNASISFGKSSENPYSLIWVTTLMAVNTHGTLSPHTFSHWMVQSVPGVFRKLWKCPQTCFCEPSNLSLLAIEVFFFPIVKTAVSIGKKNILAHFYLLYSYNFLNAFESCGKTGCYPLLLISHLTVQFHLIRVTTDMAVNAHRTFSPDIFFLMEWYSVS